MKQKKSLSVENKEEFVKDVLEAYQEDLDDRADWSDARLQRYAKLYGYLPEKTYPWPGASNQHVPMLQKNSLRTQDTLHNAVLGSRPVVSAIAINKADAPKGIHIDELQDYQLFEEQPGEERIGTLIQSFTDDGTMVAFVPWVKESRQVLTITPLPPIPEGTNVILYEDQYLKQEFPPDAKITTTSEGIYKLEWTDEYGKKYRGKAEFYVDADERPYVECTKDKVIYDGPCVLPVQLEDLVIPSRCENLQPPGPSNPTGADHVVMVDYPSWDEINRHIASGYYDLIDEEHEQELRERAEGDQGTRHHGQQNANDPEQHKVQKDELVGLDHGNAQATSKCFTRLTYFGRFDIDEDGFEEEIVARIILETRTLCRLRHLQAEYPTPIPQRPFESASFIPRAGQFYGIGLLELLESLQDSMKVVLDQMVDKHTLSNTPWGLYRSASGIRPETIRIEPGLLHPVSNPQNDVVFPQFPQQDQAMAMNLLAMWGQWVDQVSMQGNLQFGGVPQGKASALRTSTNMMSVLQQGDARPERILRRFFRGLAGIYRLMHQLNQVYLPPDKQYRVNGVPTGAADPYKKIKSPRDIAGEFQFSFKANALNTQKGMKADILRGILPIITNGLTLQMGLTDAERIYNILKDIIDAGGLDDTRYLKAPASANTPKITAEDAMGQMVRGELPQGLPAEGAAVHFQALTAFQQDPRFQHLIQYEPAFGAIYQAYLQQVQVLVQQEEMQAQMAQQFAGAMGGGDTSGAQPGPQGQVDPMAGQMQQQGPGQLNDESMPGAKGGFGG